MARSENKNGNITLWNLAHVARVAWLGQIVLELAGSDWRGGDPENW